MKRSFAKLSIWVLLVFLSVGTVLTARAQTTTGGATTKQNPADNNAETIITHVVEALGGNNYLGVRTVIGRGFFTSYQEGVSQLPSRFLDYLAYPDKERTEFSSNGIRIVQTNNGATGWLYDGATKSLHDMKPAQIEDFKRGMRTSFENVLHGWWRKEGATLKYIGRREAGVGKRNETIKLTYPDGFWIEYEFGARDWLPAKVIYKRTRAKADSDETEEITEEDRLAKPITINGVTVPYVIDHYIDGKQTSRINYESVEINAAVPDSLFIKPASIKSFK
ncbi:MAG: hypothetical protein ABI967_10860 [bacterium]